MGELRQRNCPRLLLEVRLPSGPLRRLRLQRPHPALRRLHLPPQRRQLGLEVASARLRSLRGVRRRLLRRRQVSVEHRAALERRLELFLDPLALGGEVLGFGGGSPLLLVQRLAELLGLVRGLL